MPAKTVTVAALDFRCGPRLVLTRRKARVECGPQVYTLAAYLRHKRCVSLDAAKVKLWGDKAKPDNSVSQVGRRLNEVLIELGSSARVQISDGRVLLK